MLTEYIEAAMRHADYDILEDKTFYGEIPNCPGVYSNAGTLEACREELKEILEGWILIRLREGLDLPVLEGIDLLVDSSVGSL